MDKEYNNIFNMKGQSLHFIDDENKQENNFRNSPFLTNFTMSSTNRNVRVIKDIRANRNDNTITFMTKKEKAEYNPIFNNNIKGKYNYI